VTLVHFPIAGPQELETVFVGIAKSRAEAAFIIPDQSWAQGQERRIGDLALKGRLATSGTRREFADAGCLMSYGANFHDLWRKAAVYVDKILKGAAPSDLPIEQPTKFELVINMRTARRLGLTIPAALLHRADVVID
jgi:putative ABC transport system substrate-binding protein